MPDLCFYPTDFGDGSVFPQRIKRLRHAAGMTAADVAEAIFVAPATVYWWEQGRSIPRLDSAAALARLFGVSLDYLAGTTDRKNPPE